MLSQKVERTLRGPGWNSRRGTVGGGNQLRQPYLRKLMAEREFEKYPQVDHVHFYGYYIGNYPDLERGKILELCALLNHI